MSTFPVAVRAGRRFEVRGNDESSFTGDYSMATASGLASCGPCGNWHKVETRVRTDITVSIRKYAANTREYAANTVRKNTREYAENTRTYARIRKNTQIYPAMQGYTANTREYARIRRAGCAANKQANTLLANIRGKYAGYAQGYSANTQEYATDILEYSPRICVWIWLYQPSSGSCMQVCSL